MLPTRKASAELTCVVPVNYGVLLFPGFEALDVFGPLEALNLLSLSQTMNLSLIAKTLDPVSTKPRSAAMNAANSSFGEIVVPTHTFEDDPSLDVLLIPGGIGTRAIDGGLLDAELAYIQKTAPKVPHFITVCTGAALAAKAGALDGKNATTNKAAWKWATSQSTKVNWIAQARWVQDGNTWTGSGVSAGTDAMLAWIGYTYGEDIATKLANGMEFVRAKSSTDDPFAALNNCTDVPPH